jgi:hypothetical protein
MTQTHHYRFKMHCEEGFVLNDHNSHSS